MIPLRDSEPTATKSVVVPAIIILNVLAFFYELSLGMDLEPWLFENALIPARYFALARMGPGSLLARFSPVVVSMFLHGGWLHIIFNMLFLWVFGNNVEDRLGKGRFIVFYFLCGIAAAYLQLYTNPSSRLPMVGASGAIAGVMGGYIVLFPRARILTLVPIFFFIQLIEVPAILFIGFWFLIQFLSGAAAIVSQAGREAGEDVGGVAWWAHVGGFAAGAIFVKIFTIGVRFRGTPRAA